MFRAIHDLVLVTSHAALFAVFAAGCAIQAADPTDQMLSALDGTEGARPTGEAAGEAVRLGSRHLPEPVRDRASEVADGKAMTGSPQTPAVAPGKIAVGIHAQIGDRAPLASATTHCEAGPDQRLMCCTFVGDIPFACRTSNAMPEPN